MSAPHFRLYMSTITSVDRRAMERHSPPKGLTIAAFAMLLAGLVVIVATRAAVCRRESLILTLQLTYALPYIERLFSVCPCSLREAIREISIGEKLFKVLADGAYVSFSMREP